MSFAYYYSYFIKKIYLKRQGRHILTIWALTMWRKTTAKAMKGWAGVPCLCVLARKPQEYDMAPSSGGNHLERWISKPSPCWSWGGECNKQLYTCSEGTFRVGRC